MTMKTRPRRYIEITRDEAKVLILALGSTCIATFEGHSDGIKRAAHGLYDRLLSVIFPGTGDRLIFDLTEAYTNRGSLEPGYLPDRVKGRTVRRKHGKRRS
jgi:hypothetical protein